MSDFTPSAGRHVLVTGSAAGLGAGIALRLAQHGYSLTLTHRPGEAATPPTASLAAVREYDADAQSYAVDFQERVQTTDFIAQLARDRKPVDILVHAVGPLQIRQFARTEMREYDQLLEANLGSSVLLSAAVLPAMRAQHFGRLIFFGMTGSSVTKPNAGFSLYGAAKAGLTSFARTLSLEEAARGITVNCLEPGDIRDKTQNRAAARLQPANNPSGSAGSWEDIADAVEFLISPNNAFINGAVLAVGGGLVNASG